MEINEMSAASYVFRQDLNQVDAGKASLLGRLDIELTERCNNRCIHCCINLPANNDSAKKKELSTSAIKKILREACSLGCVTVRFTGGEPLLRPDFEELYVFARRLGLKVLLFTNATLITKKMAELFARIPPLEKIEVSVYGMTKQSYEAVSGVPGSFLAFRRGIDLLLKHKIPFVVKGALLPQNRSEIKKFESWAATIPWMEKAPSYSMFFDLRNRRDDALKNEMIKKYRLSSQEGLKILTRKKKAYIREMKRFCVKFMKPSGKTLFSCGAGTGGGCVDAYGFFQPCMMLRHPDCLYDLRKGTLQDALERFFPKLRKKKARDVNYVHRCARCFLKGLCEQCPAKSWTEFGTLDTPVDYLCGIAHAQAEFLGLLKKGEKGWEAIDGRDRITRFSNS